MPYFISYSVYSDRHPHNSIIKNEIIDEAPLLWLKKRLEIAVNVPSPHYEFRLIYYSPEFSIQEEGVEELKKLLDAVNS